MVYRHVGAFCLKCNSNCILGSTLALIGLPLTTLLARKDFGTVCQRPPATSFPAHAHVARPKHGYSSSVL